MYEESFDGTGLQEAVGWWDGAVTFGPASPPTSRRTIDSRSSTIRDNFVGVSGQARPNQVKRGCREIGRALGRDPLVAT